MQSTNSFGPSKCTWYKGADHSKNPHSKIIYSSNSQKKILPNILHTVGNTPLIKLNRIPQNEGIECEILVKCEFLNPGGSVKDRIAVRMIEDAERRGLLKPGSTIIELTSGNTGIGVAMVAAVKGYRCVIAMPTSCTSNKTDIVRALGAEVIKVPISSSPISAEEVQAICEKLQAQNPNSFICQQFYNKENPLAHYDSTATEILEQCNGKIDMMVLGAGTGGSVTGIGRKFKELCPNCIFVGAVAAGFATSNITSHRDNSAPATLLEGVENISFTRVYDKSLIDLWVYVNDVDAFSMAKRLHLDEGILSGGTGGLALAAAMKAASKLKANQRCVVLLPDAARNYLNTFISDQWMEAKYFKPCVNVHDHWWWNQEISALSIKYPVVIQEVATCSEALDVMEQNCCEILAVLDSIRVLVGMITDSNIMNLLSSRGITLDDPVGKASTKTYTTLSPNTKLGLVSRILEKESFVLVVCRDLAENEVKNGCKINAKHFLGVITKMNLLQYIKSNKDNCAQSAEKI